MGEDGRGSSMVWGRREKQQDRGKVECTLLLSPRVLKSITTHGGKGSRIAWAVGKMGIVKYA